VHLLGQTWVYQTPVRLDHFAPVGLALLVATPGWFGVYLADWLRNALGALWLVFVLALTPSLWISPAGEISSLSLNLLFGAGICAYLVYRERKIAPCDGAFVMGTLALLGATLSAQLEQFWVPQAALLPLLLLACAAWLVLVRRSSFRVVLGALLLLWWACHGLKYLGVWKKVEPEYVRLVPLLLLTFGAVLRWHWAWRMLLFHTGFYLGVRACGSDLPRDLFYFLLAAPVLAFAAGRIHKHAVLPVLGVYALCGNLNRFGLPQVQGGLNTGWLIIAGAFGVFGLALLVTRLQVKQRT
jgi:hypothetical protein